MFYNALWNTTNAVWVQIHFDSPKIVRSIDKSLFIHHAITLGYLQSLMKNSEQVVDMQGRYSKWTQITSVKLRTFLCSFIIHLILRVAQFVDPPPNLIFMVSLFLVLTKCKITEKTSGQCFPYHFTIPYHTISYHIISYHCMFSASIRVLARL